MSQLNGGKTTDLDGHSTSGTTESNKDLDFELYTKTTEHFMALKSNKLNLLFFLSPYSCVQ